MKKNVWITLITFITLSFVYPLSSYSDIITKDGVKIQIFQKGQKKPISVPDPDSEDVFYTETDDCIDKIVFSGKSVEFTDDNKFTVKITNYENDQVLLFKDKIEFYFYKKVKSYSLPVHPWISEYGKYRIEIKRNDETLIDFLYEIHVIEGC
jgi:hypothetical protein